MLALSELFDVFRLFLIEFGKVTTSPAVRVQQFIERGMDRLGVAVLGALNKQRHEPDDEHGYAVKVDCGKSSPHDPIEEENCESIRTGGEVDANLRDPAK